MGQDSSSFAKINPAKKPYEYPTERIR